jgi:hypothetical protein
MRVLRDFSQMSLASRALALRASGTFLCRGRHVVGPTSLYLFHDNFVEVLYEKTSGMVSDIRLLSPVQYLAAAAAWHTKGVA